jgi:hypothetical protein
MYRLMMSAREFSLDKPEENMVALKLRTAPDRNRLKKNMKRTRYTDLGQSEGLYRQKFNNKRKAHEETGAKMSSKATSPPGGAASRGPAPWCGVVPPGSVSYSFLSRDFSYLIKITKV